MMIRNALILAILAMLAGGAVQADVQQGVNALGRGNYEKAREIFEPLAMTGDWNAQGFLAHTYRMMENNVEAYAWYHAMAKCGSVDARIELGMLVTGVTYRHPGLLAKTVTTLDVLSGGRAMLGLGAALEARGFGVAFTRHDDRTMSLEERTAIAESVAGDVFVSVHANAARRRSVRGIETYYLNENHERHSLNLAARENGIPRSEVNALQHTLARLHMEEIMPYSQRLARLVQERMVNGFPRRRRRPQGSGDHLPRQQQRRKRQGEQ